MNAGVFNTVKALKVNSLHNLGFVEQLMQDQPEHFIAQNYQSVISKAINEQQVVNSNTLYAIRVHIMKTTLTHCEIKTTHKIAWL